MSAISIYPFTDVCFFNTLSNRYCSAERVSGNDRARYILGYLKNLGAQMILVEGDYVDGDYVDDFSTYYVKCFKSYEIKCKRLHFFSQAAPSDIPGVVSIVSGQAPEEVVKQFQESYLGFLVARPLPNAIIGRTVLKSFLSPLDVYTSVKNYNVNLLGLDLCLRDTLAFQEQDTVVAVCAAVALWTSFHKASDLFGTPCPRPSAITLSANKVIGNSRPFPSKGLNTQQVRAAIVRQGLEPECFPVNIATLWPELLYGYLKMGLAPLVALEISGHADSLHAITLLGYALEQKIDTGHMISESPHAVPTVARRISAFYGHDDQVGPFARHVVTKTDLEGHHPLAFTGTWPTRSEAEAFLYPVYIAVPVYNKIRVTFVDVFKWIMRLNSLVKRLLNPQKHDHEWDIYLTTTNQYKSALKDELPGSKSIIEALLLEQHPRFIWRALLKINGISVWEVLFDATDIPRAFPGYCIAWHNASLREQIAKLCTAEEGRCRKFLPAELYDFMSAACDDAEFYFATNSQPAR